MVGSTKCVDDQRSIKRLSQRGAALARGWVAGAALPNQRHHPPRSRARPLFALARAHARRDRAPQASCTCERAAACEACHLA